MIIFSLFILFLLAENLLLPALIGPGQFFITPIFIIALLTHAKSLRSWIIQAIILIILEIIFTGINAENIVAPLIITAALYLIMNRYINFNEQFRDDFSFRSIILSTVILTLLTVIYSALSILLHNSFGLSESWPDLKMFFVGSIFSVAGWSLGISILFKFIRPK
jgi:hypothetical protein